MLQKPGLIAELEPLHWQHHTETILNGPLAHLEIAERREIATRLGLVAVFFIEPEILGRAHKFAAHEVATGRANRAVYINLLNGGTPFHEDLVNSMRKQGADPRTTSMRTSAYNLTEFVGAHVIDSPEYLPQGLGPGDEAVFTDDGLDTGESLIESGEFIRERYEVTDISALTAITKQPGMVIAKFRGTSAMFATPYGLWGEYYGFNDDHRANEPGYNRNERVIGLAMAQPEAAYERLEHVLHIMGGTDGLAIASIDQIREFNRARNLNK